MEKIYQLKEEDFRRNTKSITQEEYDCLVCPQNKETEKGYKCLADECDYNYKNSDGLCKRGGLIPKVETNPRAVQRRKLKKNLKLIKK